MKYQIDEEKTDIKITINEIGSKREEFLKAFQECQEGRCSCPTSEYEKLQDLDIQINNDDITLILKAKDGMKLDKNNIKKCLDYTSSQVEEE